MKQDVKLKMCKVVSGNIIVIDNKVHQLNPKDTWKVGKHWWYIIREIDRLPVSNSDYPEMRNLGRDTDILGVLVAKEINQTFSSADILKNFSATDIGTGNRVISK